MKRGKSGFFVGTGLLILRDTKKINLSPRCFGLRKAIKNMVIGMTGEIRSDVRLQ